MLISPWSKKNYVDHTLTDQSSIIRFVEDNWLSGQRIGSGSFDSIAGTVNNMFDFAGRDNRGLYLLDPSTGLAASGGNHSGDNGGDFGNW
jgi:phospholipase C